MFKKENTHKERIKEELYISTKKKKKSDIYISLNINASWLKESQY